MPQEKSVFADSLPADQEATSTHPSNDDVMPDGRTPKDVWAESKRVAEENKTLKAEIASTKESLAHFEEIAKERELTSREKKEVSNLEDDLEAQAQKLMEQKETKPWMKVSEKIAEEKALYVVTNAEIQRANDFIDEQAFKLGITPEELTEKMKKFAPPLVNSKGETISLWRRNFVAFIAFQKDEQREKNLQERENKLKEAEDAEQRFRETGTRTARDSSRDEQWNKEPTVQGKVKLLVDLMDQSPGHDPRLDGLRPAGI